MPGLIARGRVREAILELPLIDGSPETIPDAALWASVVCLGILCSIYRYEDRNDGHEGIVRGARKEAFTNVHGEPDEEPETIGIPRNIVIPFRQICTRLGRPLPYLSQSDVSLHNYKVGHSPNTFLLFWVELTPRFATLRPRFRTWHELKIWTSDGPYSMIGVKPCSCCAWYVKQRHDVSKKSNYDLQAESHGLFQTGPDILAGCQERAMHKDNEGLLYELIRLKDLVDQMSYVFHKISVNPHSGENFGESLRLLGWKR